MQHWNVMPELGTRFGIERQVGAHMSAESCGSGNLPVLGTPALVALLEEASFRSVSKHLLPGYETVGTHISIDHIKATAIGETISCYAELVKIEGRALTFKVFAEDSSGLISQGVHSRFVVSRDHFMQKV